MELLEYATSYHLGTFMQIARVLRGFGIAVLICGLLCLILLSLALYMRWHLAGIMQKRRATDPRQQPVYLELVFPADASKSAFATQQLHILMRGQAMRRSFLETLAGEQKTCSLEIVATREDGIRY